MKKSIKPSLLAASILSVFFPLTVHSSIEYTYSPDGNEVVIDGKGGSHFESVVEGSGVSGTVHDMTVKNIILNVSTFSGINFKSAISLAGNNGSLEGSGQDYGSLSINVQDSAISGGSSDSFSAIYARTDSTDATIKVTSNSEIFTFGDARTHGMLLEAFGENGMVDVTLQEGSAITISNFAEDDSAGVRVIGTGGVSVRTAENSNITAHGAGNSGIYITAGDLGGLIENKGRIELISSGYAIRSSVGGSGLLTINNSGALTTNGVSSHAIWANQTGTGDIEIINSGEINADMSSSDGILAEGNGNIYVENSGTITVHNKGINASTTNGDITIINTGTIESQNSEGIWANQTSTGDINIINSGVINAESTSSDAILAEGKGDIYVENNGTLYAYNKGINVNTTSGGITVINTGTIDTRDDRGILAKTDSGDVVVYAENNITTGQRSGTSHNHGIDAQALDAGAVDVYYDNGTITVVNERIDDSGNSIGIASWDGGSGSDSVDASIHLGSNAIIDATEGNGGLQVRSNGTGTINIAQGAEVHGGTDYGVNIYALATTAGGVAGSPGIYEINNAGIIDSLNDKAILVDTLAGSILEINNTGTITGYLTLGAEDATVNNMGIWDIRNAAYNPFTGAKDKAVAVSDFGDGDNVFHNESIIRLLNVENNNAVTTINQYLTSGALSITNSGISQAQLTNLDRFENRGVIDLSSNGQAGDLLMITGGAGGSSATNGGGQYISDGGFLILDTVLNEGGDNALSDVLVVDNAVLGSGATGIIINRVDGLGSVTSGDGIQVVEVLGDADAGSFKLANVVKAGIYEYTLHQGALSDPSNNSLFLRANSQQINPDIGSYLANQTAATGLFMHSLHDRLGEPQFYEHYRNENRKTPAFWLRGSVAHSKNEAASGSLKQSTDNSVIHLGGELVDWTSNGNNRYHLGVMGAYGRSETKTTSKITGSRVDSNVNGYGVGAYLTWYSNEFAPEGWYADVWSMYSWFDNEVESAENYDSKVWTTSLELGYAAKIKTLEDYDWVLEPQAQLAYHYYNVSDIEDSGGTLTVNNSDANGISSRLGVRTYLRPLTDRNRFQPFFEANWLYNSANNSMDFNGEAFASDMPENRFETKIGLQGEIAPNLQVYSHIGYQFGQNSYSRTEGQIGVRYRF